MRIIRLILLVFVGLFVLYVKLSTVTTTPPLTPAPLKYSDSTASTAPTSPHASVPDKALKVLQVVRTTGNPPDGYVGGRVFENREGRLPASGDYREFDVDPHNGQRNAERLIVEWNTKKAWYTGDHYQTFIPLP
jgi:ribonuclease T1